MHAVLPPRHRLPLFTAASTRVIERHSMLGLPSHALMRRAGEAVARLAMALAPHAERVWVAAGPGNNGGDGLEAATWLQTRGMRVCVTLAADAARLPPDAASALAGAQAAGIEIATAGWPDLQPTDLAIDALLGIGASRSPQGPIASLIRRLNSLACPVLAVDVPSGLNVDTGQPVGEVCVAARHTLSLLTLKPGLFTAAGRDHTGVVWLHELDTTRGATPADAWLTGSEDAAAATNPRQHAHHKGSFGDVAVVGGAPGMAGAALLAARAAHTAGAGRTYVMLLAGDGMTHDPMAPELMFRPDWLERAGPHIANTTIVCGCGGGDAVHAVLKSLLSRACRLVLDADALNAVARDKTLQALLSARGDAGHPTILTPHPLEAARLLSDTASAVQSDRLAATARLSSQFGCVVLLKGSGSVLAAPGQAPMVNPTGNAALASAGTGDVLAGWLGGLWSQTGALETAAKGSSPSSMSPLQVAAAAAYMHGAAADRAAKSPMRASDLIEEMHRAGLGAFAEG